MSLFVLAKIVHIISVMFFIGIVGFRTFMMPAIKKRYGVELYLKSEKAVGLRARKIIAINNIALLVSGLYLFSFHMDVVNTLLHIKIILGLTLALTFYVVPLIMSRFNYIKWFSTTFHHLFFSLMMITVVMSQIMFS